MVGLQRMRESRKLTQQELSAITGVSQQVISKIELRQSKSPRYSTLKQLAAAFKCRPGDLIEEVDAACETDF